MWMKIHVPANFIGYGAFCIAAMLGIAELWALRNENAGKKSSLPPSQVIEEVMYKVHRRRFSILHHRHQSSAHCGRLDAWGRYWSWDPKETWASLSGSTTPSGCTCASSPAGAAKSLHGGQVIGLFVTAFAFIGVNMFLSGLHSYGTL